MCFYKYVYGGLQNRTRCTLGITRRCIFKFDLDTDLAEEVANLNYRIMEALSTHSGNQTKAAKALKLGRVTFIAKAKKYELV